jgi:hypothetical protein
MIMNSTSRYETRRQFVTHVRVKTPKRECLSRNLRPFPIERPIPIVWPEGEIPLTDGGSDSANDIAEAALFLASERSRHIIGTPIWIDAGQSLLR